MKATMQVGCFFLREMGSLLINACTWMASCVGKWCALWRRILEHTYIYGELPWASCLIGDLTCSSLQEGTTDHYFLVSSQLVRSIQFTHLVVTRVNGTGMLLLVVRCESTHFSWHTLGCRKFSYTTGNWLNKYIGGFCRGFIQRTTEFVSLVFT